jgi:hypothetical protein
MVAVMSIESQIFNNGKLRLYGNNGVLDLPANPVQAGHTGFLVLGRHPRAELVLMVFSSSSPASAGERQVESEQTHRSIITKRPGNL